MWDVDLPDDSFLSEDFSIVLGIINIKWDRVTPANNVSHAVALHPLKAAYFSFTSATIPYLAQEDRPILMDFTSAPEWGGSICLSLTICQELPKILQSTNSVKQVICVF